MQEDRESEISRAETYCFDTRGPKEAILTKRFDAYHFPEATKGANLS